MNLVVENVFVRYGTTTAVAGVNWNLGAGVHALLGPNGAGKSSLLETIATLRNQSNGSISMDNATGKDIRPCLGYLPQDNLPRSRFTVREHLSYLCWLKKIPRAAYATEITRVTELCSLGEYSDTKISELSGGLRRRVGISSTLIGNPTLILLDEASAGLDMQQRDILQKIVARIAKTATVVTSTHIVEDVIDIADTVTVMTQGQFVYSGRIEDFCTHRSLDAVKQHYLKLVNS